VAARGYRVAPVRRAVDYSLERGVLHRLVERLPPHERSRVRRRLRRIARPARLGTLRRTTPLSHDFGYDRGTPIDRYYIERFLWTHRSDVRGHVLEVKDSAYTEWLATDVTGKDVLDIDPANKSATLVADLATADAIGESTFDCFILTQTLQLIYDVRAAVSHAHRILKRGGVLLATVPAVSPIVDDDQLTDYWRFTTASCRALFGGAFGTEAVQVRGYGNVLTSIGFLAGMAHEELTAQELETHDGRFAMLISVRAVKG
jgi:SAM-dependent methyltransferase